MSPKKGGARDVATRVLVRVAEEGAYAAVALDAEIGRQRLDARDAALATEIVYGSLRVLPELDAALAQHLAKPKGIDAVTRAAMRVATYQILHLDRVPPHAAVSEAVGIVRRERGPRLAGLANAVLRKVAGARPEVTARPDRIVAPPWLERALAASVGEERARAFLEARPLPPPIALRITPGVDRAALADRIRDAKPDAVVREGRVSPLALIVQGAGDPRELPGYADGAFAVQEEGSQAIGLLSGAQPGERVADACSGRGGKTALLASEVGDAGHVTAIDLHEPKLDRMKDELARLHIPPPRVDAEAIDLSVGTAGLDGRFDRVLVDAPCTGLGTVHRRPEILLRVGEGDPARMGDLQVAILGHAVRLVRPGGTVVYAVCSPMRAEGAEVARRVEAAHPDLEPIAGPWPLSTVAPDEDGIIRLGPWLDRDTGGTDAYQVLRWKRRVDAKS